MLIERERTIGFLGERARVYATPSMVNDIEYVCFRLIEEHLETGESSVGVHIEVEHLGATPMGEPVEIDISVIEVDRRLVHMQARVHDRLELVGRGKHTRFVIDVKKHATRLEDKIAKLAGSK